MTREPQFRYYRTGVTSQPPTAKKPVAKTRTHKRIYLAVLAVAVVVLLIKTGGHHTAHVHAQTAEAAPTANVAAEAAVVPKIQAVIAQDPGVTYGVSVVDVQTGKMTNIGIQTPFIAASTGKLLTAALYLHQVGTGQASLTQQIDGSPAKTWLKQMVVLSDNTAWANLNDYLTHPALTAYAKSIGITDYDTTNNMLAPHDIAQLLQKLATGALLPPAQTQLLLSYMKIANYRASIVPAVPAQDTVYHKIGFLDDYLHDAAIIQNLAGRKVVLVIYTNGNGTYDDATRNANIQQITRAVIQGYL